MTIPHTAPAGPPPPADADACWRQAARLRAEHRNWIVVWLAPEKCFKAYRRLPGARRDTALSAATPGELADLIGQAEQAARTPTPRKDRP